jgi:serine/threonine protein kinase
MEFVPNGDLTTFFNSGTVMPEYMGQLMAQQICSALDYLHKRNITHRDIKPDNILIASTDPFEVKLSDFGLSKVISDEATLLKTFCGTLLYCAPEVYPDYDRFKAGKRGKRRRNEP